MKSFNKVCTLAFVALFALSILACGTVQATMIVSQTSNTVETAFDSRIGTTDLINSGQTSFASAANTVAPVNMPGLAFTIAGTNDGATASYVTDQAGTVAKNTWYLYEDNNTTLTYSLNTNPATGGKRRPVMTLRGINVFTGWQDADLFQSQKWTFRVATLANPTFTDVQAVDYLAPGGSKSSMISLADSTGVIGAGVTAVQFFVEKSSSAGNFGIVFREIDIPWSGFGSRTRHDGLACGRRNVPRRLRRCPPSQLGDERSLIIAIAEFNKQRFILMTLRHRCTESAIAAALARAVIVVAAILSAQWVSAAAPLRIECVGDSITAGYTDNPTWNVPFEFGYRSGLYTRLNNAGYDFQFVGASVEPWTNSFGPAPHNTPIPDLRTVGQDNHRGYGGWVTAGILSNMSSFLAADNPDVVLLMIGINDNGGTAAQNNLRNIVQTIVNLTPNADVIVAQITPMVSYSQSIVDYNTYIRDNLVPTFQAQGKHVTTVDQYVNMTTNGSIDPSLFSNGINHPNLVSYDRLAETWFQGIEAVRPVPEPGTISLLAVAGLGLIGIAWRNRRR